MSQANSWAPSVFQAVNLGSEPNRKTAETKTGLPVSECSESLTKKGELGNAGAIHAPVQFVQNVRGLH